MTWDRIASRVILYRSTNEVVCAGAKRVEVVATSGAVVEVWIKPSDAAGDREPEAFVLAFGGNAARAEREMHRVLAMWRRQPVEVWAVNYPGFGGSAGPVSLAAVPAAALAAFDAISERADGRPIFVSGGSFGTAAALCVAARRAVAGAVLHNPPPLRELIFGRFGPFTAGIGAWAVSRAVPVELDSISNARECKVPAVFILAGRDGVVPPRYQQRVVDAYAGERHLIRFADFTHNTPVRGGDLEFLDPKIDWLWESFGKTK